MNKNRSAHRAAKAAEWAVAAHLNDGRILYWCGEDSKRMGQPWSPRTSQAHRFPTRGDAQLYAASCVANSSARGYEALQLRPE